MDLDQMMTWRQVYSYWEYKEQAAEALKLTSADMKTKIS
jgi:hypothetical protein